MCHIFTLYGCGHLFMSPVLGWCTCPEHKNTQVARPCEKPECNKKKTECCKKKTEPKVPATPSAHRVSKTSKVNKVTIGNREQRKRVGKFIDVFNK